MRNSSSFVKGKKSPLQGKRGQGKITRCLREAILQSFDDLGGREWLVNLGKKHPQAYASLLGKVLPNRVSFENPELPLFGDQPVFTKENPSGL